jgi:transcriptional regulator with XRE-family HTH domain
MDRENELEAAKRLGDRLKAIRVDTGLSQRDFGLKIGLSSPSLVSAMEHGDRDPSRRVLVEIHRQFGRDLNWLLGDPVEKSALVTQNEEQGQEIEGLKAENRKLSGANEELKAQIRQKEEFIDNQIEQMEALRNEVYKLLKENSGLKDELIQQIRQKTSPSPGS